MSERDVNPKTRALHNDWRLRAVRRREAKGIRKSSLQTGVKVATVVEVADNGDVRIDRLSDGSGGEWLTPVNGRTPAKGSSVVVTEIEGSMSVLGPVGEGIWSVMPDHEFIEPYYFVPEENLIAGMGGAGIYNWEGIRDHPFLSVDPMNPRIYLGAPPFFAPNTVWWCDHFLAGSGSSGDIGKENWRTFTSSGGSTTQPSDLAALHVIRLTTGTSSGNRRGIALGTNTNRDLFAIGQGSANGTIFECWWVFRPEQATSITFRAGVFDEIDIATVVKGVYFETDATNGLIEGVIQSASAPEHVANCGTFSAGEVVIVSLRIQPDFEGAEYEATRFTFTRWRESDNGPLTGLVASEGETVVIGEYSGFFGNLGAVVKTDTGSSRTVDIDYAAGFVFSPRFSFF